MTQPAAPGQPTAMDLGAALSWPTRDPRWVSKLAVIGLVLLVGLLIPIVGWIFDGLFVVSWMLTCLDNLRAERAELPEFSFSYLGRGGRLFVVLLVWGLVIGLVTSSPSIAGSVMSAAAGSGPSANPGVALAALPLFAIGSGTSIVGSLAIYLAMPPLVYWTERRGYAGGFDVGLIFGTIRHHFMATLLAGLFILVAGLVGTLGIFLCLIGVVFTLPYGYAVMAGVHRHYELELARPAPAAPAGPPATVPS